MWLNKDRQRFVKVVSFLIAIQGLAWTCLALGGIVVYKSAPLKFSTNITEVETYSEYVSRLIYDDFIEGMQDKILRPQDLYAFMWIYCILSALWFSVSLDQYIAILYNKPRQSQVTLTLGIIVLITSIIDLVLVSLLAKDLDRCDFDLNRDFIPICNDEPFYERATPVDCQIARGVILSVAARGFILWAINIILSICLIIIAAKTHRRSLLKYLIPSIPRARNPDRERRQPSPNDLFAVEHNGRRSPGAQHLQNPSRYRNTAPAPMANRNQNVLF